MDTLGKTFGPSSPKGLANLLTLAGAVSPRLTIGPYAGERLRQGGGTALPLGLLTAGQLVREGAETESTQKGMGVLFDIMSGKAPVTAETLAHIPREGLPLAEQYLAQQAEDTRFQKALQEFEADQKSRAVSPIAPGSPPSLVAPYSQDLAESRQAFQAHPTLPPITIEQITRLAKTGGPRAEKFGLDLYGKEELSIYRKEQNELRREMQQITKETREASDATKMYGIEKRFEGLQATIVGLMERIKEQEAGKTSRQETAEAGKNTRQLEKLASDMEKLQQLITAKHEDVATQEQGRTKRTGMQETGKAARQTERITAPPKPPKPGDSGVPSKDRRDALSKERQTLNDFDKKLADSLKTVSDPTERETIEARRLGVRKRLLQISREFQGQPAVPPSISSTQSTTSGPRISPQEEAARIMKKLGM